MYSNCGVYQYIRILPLTLYFQHHVLLNLGGAALGTLLVNVYMFESIKFSLRLLSAGGEQFKESRSPTHWCHWIQRFKTGFLFYI